MLYIYQQNVKMNSFCVVSEMAGLTLTNVTGKLPEGCIF